MLEYIKRVADRTFEELPFTEVDNLIFAQLSYLGYEGGALPTALKNLEGGVTYGVIEKNRELFEAVIHSRRFRECIALGYAYEFSQKETCQFAAVSFLLPDGTAYAAFRGTDSTLVGWKEDFMLAFATPVPAQLRAAQYLDEISAALDCPLRVGGHSKGGNLAVYAAAFCGEAARRNIREIYTNDGPGFEQEIIDSEEYRAIRPRIHRFIPESSVIGELLENDAEYEIIDSSGIGIFQHNPYSWKTEGCGFVKKAHTTFVSNVFNFTLRSWLKNMDEDKRRFLTDTLFDIVGAGNARTLREAFTDPISLVQVIAAANRLDREDKRQLLELAQGFGKVLIKDK